MASNPPFVVEDTDEDFFDKLVDDDDDFDVNVASSSSVSRVGDGNLRIGDDLGGENGSGDFDGSIGDDLGGLNGSGGFDRFVKAASLISPGVSVGEFKEVKSGAPVISPVVSAGEFKEEKSSVPVISPVVSVREFKEEKSNVPVISPVVSIGEFKEEKRSVPVSTLLDGSDNVFESDKGLVKSSLDFDDSGSGTKGTVMTLDSTSNPGGKGSSGIKEVQWSDFNSDALQNGGTGLEPYSDIFGEFGGVKTGEIFNSEANVIYGNEEHKSAYTDDNLNYSQYQDDQVNSAEPVYSADGQDMNSTEYWESLYPGWKYDQNTGQWYQVDGYDANTRVEGSFDTTVPSETSEVAYLQQTSQSSVGTVSQSGTIESVTNWNQTSHVGDATEMASNWNQVAQTVSSAESVSNWDQVPSTSNGYPSHMYFDPQYPGWYYDTVTQEWCSLDTYISSTQSATQSENLLNQNGYASTVTSQGINENLGVYGQAGHYGSGGYSNQGQEYNWPGSSTNFNQQDLNMWQPNSATSSYRGYQQLENQYDQKTSVSNHISQQSSYQYEGTVPYGERASQSHNEFSNTLRNQSFVTDENYTQQYNQPQTMKDERMNTSSNYYGNQNVASYTQQQYQSYAPAVGRSSDGRPAHALVSFGFGGKLIILKDNNNTLGNSSYGGQVPSGGSISVLNLMEVVSERPDSSNTRPGVCDYFNSLCRQSIPGPLTGGNVSAKELYRWTDERIANCQSPDIDYRKGEVLRLLLSLLKIALMHYGKLRSAFGTDTVLKGTDAPESAVARLFAAAKGNGSDSSNYGAIAHCLQNLPSEGQMRATAAEVQTLLVSGRKKDALFCAQKGQLWGPALVLAAQLGDQFYVDTVKQMALHQLIPGSPLRTLCLLIAGQPAEVFSVNSTTDGNISNATNVSPLPAQLGANGMLDDWEENLAVITANRTKDDELVLIHLGDCLWKERSEVCPRVSASQSTMAMSSLIPSASMEPISEWTADGNRRTMHNRSASEPDFSRTPRQDQNDSSKEASSAQGKASVSGGTSRFGRFGFGSQLLTKILKPRQDKQKN
uniref:Protein transport protein sec16 n=1 Tax=Daucus carota subsp. sativus TaxID=79200 RepID=A0A175YMH6_DAUCS